MWHWNSLWAPAPGDPPAVDDPALYRSPWSAVQGMALQARAWDTMVSASRTWWSFWMAALPLPGALPTGFVTPPANHDAPPAPQADTPPAAKKRVSRPRAPAPAARRAPHAESRSGLQARKR